MCSSGAQHGEAIVDVSRRFIPVIFDRQALLKQHGSQKRGALHISPSAYEAGKERMEVENTVVSFVK